MSYRDKEKDRHVEWCGKLLYRLNESGHGCNTAKGAEIETKFPRRRIQLSVEDLHGE